MPLFPIVMSALVLGITEFLPIGSSGHEVLLPALAGWPDQGLEIDLAVHVGMLAAALAYFWRDIALMLSGLGGLAKRRADEGAKLALNIAIATFPALVIGLALPYFLGDLLHSVHVVAWTMIGFAAILYLADRMGITVNRLEHMTVGQALAIGLVQILAVIPGTGRSAIAIVAARMFGYERAEAARFSFLLSIPALAVTGLVEGYDVATTAEAGQLQNAALAAGLSALAGFFAIAFTMRWLQDRSFTIFAVYRLLLGAALLYLIYFAGR